MVKITVISVGKMKEKFFLQAIEEYSKRLSRYAQLNLVELRDEPTPDNPTEKEKQQILSKEGSRILEKLPKDSFVVTLCVEGKELSSEEFSALIEKTLLTKSSIVFIIGGSLGL